MNLPEVIVGLCLSDKKVAPMITRYPTFCEDDVLIKYVLSGVRLGRGSTHAQKYLVNSNKVLIKE